MSEMAVVEMVVAKLLHDLSTPLASVGLNMDTLGECPEDRRAKVLQRAQKNLAAVWAIIEKRQAFIRARGRKLPFSVGEATTAAVDACKQGFDQDVPVAVIVDIQSDFEVVGSPELWDSLTQNLLNNAVRAISRNNTPNPQTVQIKIERIDDQHGSVTFTDSGIGMTNEQLSQFWEASFTTQGSGSWHGLGKLIIKDALEFHDGQIDISSTPDVGTKFAVTLPIAPLDWESTLTR